MASHERIFGWVYYGFQILILPRLIESLLFTFGTTPTDLQLNLIYFAINFVATIGIFHQFLWTSLKKAAPQFGKCIKTALLGFVMYFAMSFVVSNGILILYPEYANANNATISTMAKDNILLMFLATVFLVPVAEETVFRGLIFSNIFNHSKILAYIATAVAFGAIHVVGYLPEIGWFHGLLSLIQYLPAGIALGWTYEKTDTIVTPVLLHTLINLIGIFTVR